MVWNLYNGVSWDEHISNPQTFPWGLSLDPRRDGRMESHSFIDHCIQMLELRECDVVHCFICIEIFVKFDSQVVNV